MRIHRAETQNLRAISTWVPSFASTAVKTRSRRSIEYGTITRVLILARLRPQELLRDSGLKIRNTEKRTALARPGPRQLPQGVGRPVKAGRGIPPPSPQRVDQYPLGDGEEELR